MFLKKSFALVMILIGTMDFCAQKKQDEDYHSDNSAAEKKKKKEKVAFSERLVYGGNLGLWLGASSYIQVSPMVGYKVTDWWAAGVGFNYTYFGNKQANINYYGPSVWTRVRPLPGFYLHSEYIQLTTNYYNKSVPVWLVGGGVTSRGELASVSLFLMYDLIQHEYSPYRGALLPSGGLLIGF